MALAGLLAAVALALLWLLCLTVYVWQAGQYAQGRGSYRDAETERLEEQMRESVCDVLGTLPADESELRDARVKYRCGPVAPLSP